jgi:hypothetical protein
MINSDSGFVLQKHNYTFAVIDDKIAVNLLIYFYGANNYSNGNTR